MITPLKTATALRLSLVILASFASRAGAQRIRGDVVDAVSNVPIPGVVVWVGDSAGRMVARTIANSGKYALRMTSSARELHAVRIGYRPAVVRISPADTLVDLRLHPLPVRLSEVTTVGHRMCPGDKRVADGFDLWDQARAALLASVVAREAQPPRIRLQSHEKVIDPLTRRVTRQNSSSKEIVVDRSYVAGRSAPAFSVLGYMLEDRTERTYFAPDNETLLDPTFADTHCLTAMAADRAHEGQVGIAFEPMRADAADTLVDVKGVLWLDRDSPALRSIEFTYTGLEPAARESGGEVTFASMPNGVSMVKHWSIHTAIIAVDAARDDGPPRRPPPRELRRNARLTGMHEAGGDVTFASWPDGTTWHGDFPRAVGIVTDSAGRPVGGARVWIAKSSDTVSTDAEGRFALPYVQPGLYALLAADSVLAAAGIALTAPTWIRLDGNAETRVRLMTHPRAEVLRQLCGESTRVAGTGVIIGTAMDPLGNAVPNAKIDVWRKYQTPHVELFRQEGVGEAGADGRFVICGTPLDQRLRVRVSTATESAEFFVDWAGDVFVARPVLRPPS